MVYSKKALHILARAGVEEVEYQLGLEFCVRNDVKQALHWLKRAAFKKHTKAIEVIQEIIERKLTIF